MLNSALHLTSYIFNILLDKRLGKKKIYSELSIIFVHSRCIVQTYPVSKKALAAILSLSCEARS